LIWGTPGRLGLDLTPVETAPLEIPVALVQLLGRLSDPVFAGRLLSVYRAGAAAIGKLSDLDLLKYEVVGGDESPDLALWEEMAPVIRDTVMGVNGLLFAIREQFVVGQAGLLESPGGGEAQAAGVLVLDARRAALIRGGLEGGMNQLALQITELGELMRNPQVVSDRWTLLSELQRFRSRFREEIGDLIYESVSRLCDVRRVDVVPGYSEALQSDLLVRATVTDLRRVTEARLKLLREAQPEDLQWNVLQLEKELDLFGRTPAYAALRAQDKRAVIEFRQALGALSPRARPSQEEVVGLMELFAERVAALSKVNKRQLLRAHDHEVLAACGVRLEHAEQHRGQDPVASARALAEAALIAQSLYGRDVGLDAFLRRSRKQSLASLSGEALLQHMEQLRTLLANLSF